MTLQEITSQTPVGECFEWEGQKYLVELCIPPKKVCVSCCFHGYLCVNSFMYET